MSYPPKSARPLKSPDLLTIQEVAAEFGKSVETIRRWRAQGLIKACSITKRSVFFTRQELNRMMKEAQS